MRVGIATHYMPPHMGGIERVAEALAAGFRDRGLEVRWVASRDPSSAPRRENGRIRVRCWNALERRLGVPVPVWGTEAWREMHALARWADVLHVHDCLYPGSVWGVLLGRHLRKPVVLSQHVGLVSYPNPLLRAAERGAYSLVGRAVLRAASHVVYASSAAERLVGALLGYTPSRASFIPNGIDLSRFEPRSKARRAAARDRLRLDHDARVVLFVGRLVEKKGARLALDVSRALPDVRFVFIGDGPLSTLFRTSRANVTWLRAAAPAQMPDYFQAADCLLLPSRGEGLPLVVQEALACGLPIVLCEGEPYATELATRGLCVAVEPSAGPLSEATKRTLSGVDVQHRERARAHACQHWDLARTADRYVALFESLAFRPQKADG